ncbi:MAG: MarR family winged helix-turn-helix transcriptional regulator [Hyphomicrobiaceae bacterium]
MAGRKTSGGAAADRAAVTGCTALRFRKAARRVSQIYDHHLVPYGLTITQFGLLAHIRRLDRVTIGTLAAELVMDPTTLSRNLRPLEQRGLVRSEPSANDRRQRELRVTDDGYKTLKAARAGWKSAQDHLAEVLDDDYGPLSGAIDRMLLRLAD